MPRPAYPHIASRHHPGAASSPGLLDLHEDLLAIIVQAAGTQQERHDMLRSLQAVCRPLRNALDDRRSRMKLKWLDANEMRRTLARTPGELVDFMQIASVQSGPVKPRSTG